MRLVDLILKGDFLAGIALTGGLVGMGVVAGGKISEIREKEKASLFPPRFWARKIGEGKEKIKTTWESLLDSLSWDLFLQKCFSRVRIWALKIERLSRQNLKNLRRKTKEKKEREAYWKRLTSFSEEED